MRKNKKGCSMRCPFSQCKYKMYDNDDNINDLD